MKALTSLFAILIYIEMSTLLIVFILQKEVPKKTYRLINSIGMLPAIPVFWLINSNLEYKADRFTFFYLPLIMTFFLIFLLIYRIIRFIKD